MRVINYLSFSSMSLFEMSPEKWVEKYIYKQKERISRNMVYGKQLAEGMEKDEMSGDPVLDIMMVRLPRYDLADKIIEDANGIEIVNRTDGKTYKVPFLTSGKEKIPLVALPDSAKKDYSAFLEYKTSTRKWTQKMVDESGQIDFYATVIWLKTAKIAQDIELIVVQTEYAENGSLRPTGELWRYPTKRSMINVIKTTKRMKSAWHGIQQLCESELL